MIAFAIQSLALALLIWLACYGIMFVVNALGAFVFDSFKMMIISWVGVLMCAVLITWGIWFVAQRWAAS